MPGLDKNRKRNVTVAFRATPEEKELVCLLAEAAGMTRQDYIMSKLTDTAVVVQPSTRTYKALRREMARVCAELSRIRRAGDMGEELERRVVLLVDIFCELGEEVPEAQADAEAAAIAGMTRG